MPSTEQLIENLSHGLQPVKATACPYKLFIKWFGFVLLYTVLILLISGLRVDISEKLASPLFVAEIIMLVLLMVSTSLLAAFLSFPDICQKNCPLLFSIPPLLFFGVLTAEYIGDKPPIGNVVHGIECLLCITVFAIIPSFVIFKLLSKQATTHCYLAGMVSLLSASSIGAIILRLSEDYDSISHLIKWHYLPVIGLSLLGLWLGRKILKW
jgi:hypothetical protein